MFISWRNEEEDTWNCLITPSRLTTADGGGNMERSTAISLLMNSSHPLSCPSQAQVKQYLILPILTSERKIINENSLSTEICKIMGKSAGLGAQRPTLVSTSYTSRFPLGLSFLICQVKGLNCSIPKTYSSQYIRNHKIPVIICQNYSPVMHHLSISDPVNTNSSPMMVLKHLILLWVNCAHQTFVCSTV